MSSVASIPLASQPAFDFEAPDPPPDSVSCMQWSPIVNYLAVGSWDNSVRIYEALPDAQAHGKAIYKHPAPVLGVCWNNDGTKVLSGCADNAGYMYDLTTGQIIQVAAHDAPIKDVKWIDSQGGILATGSWDRTVKFWDLRTPTPVLTNTLPQRCYAMDVCFPLMVVACADMKINIYNLTEPSKVYKSMESVFKTQTRAISCFPSADGFALGGVEARAALTYINDSSKNYTFKCHRRDLNTPRQQLIFAINAISFHPIYGTFSTAGSDGAICFWDGEHRTRTKLFPRRDTPVTCTGFNKDGSLFAFAYSYDWHRGFRGNLASMETRIVFHKCSPDEVKQRLPKS